MADILHRFTVRGPVERVFQMFANPEDLNCWWTLDAKGSPDTGGEYCFGFGPEYQWRGIVTGLVPNQWLEWEMTEADPDWKGTRVGVRLSAAGDGNTSVDFYHSGWKSPNEHFRVSSNCWALYLRLLRRFVEHGEQVPYSDRDSA